MKILVTLFLSIISTSAVFAHAMTEGDKQRILDAGYWEYCLLGAKHMLTGYDHLLFLFGVIFFLTRFQDILKFITAFTLGHCITLIFATLLKIQANYFLIDAVIALTVIYKGFDNVNGFRNFLHVKSPNLLGMVFGFGLIHGFGLSTRLQQLPLGDEGIGLVLRILSFNVGVEIGQVIALSVMLFLLSGWRKTPSFEKFSKAANVGLMLAGFMLLLMQLHGYQHTAYADDFPLNKDDHSHVHQEMGLEEASVEPVGPQPEETTSPIPPPKLDMPSAPPAVEAPKPKPHHHGDGKLHKH